MSATLVSSNTTIKVNAAVSASGTANSNTVTVYTAPAAGYAVVNIHASSAGAFDLLIGGQIVFTSGSGSVSSTGYYVGPSQTVQVRSNSGSNAVCYVSGASFVNTP